MNETDVLRDAVELMNGLVAAPGTPAELREAWNRLTVALALGPRLERRACPFCGKSGMRAATRCGYCWRALSPPVDGADSRASGEGAST